jgi:hypothetical protein
MFRKISFNLDGAMNALQRIKSQEIKYTVYLDESVENNPNIPFFL